ncbi:MAG: GntR family transcriptional regulator [Planctomycetota bacterium]
MSKEKSDKLKYRQIYEYIRDGIVSGRYGEGDKLPTQMELASRFTVSRLTVIRALRELENEGVLELRQGSGCFVGQQHKTKTRLLGLVAVYTPGPIEMIADEIGHIIRQHNYELLWRTKTPERWVDFPEHAEAQCALYQSLGIAGIFYMPIVGIRDYYVINRQIVDKFLQAGILVVLLDRDVIEYPLHSDCDVIGIDSFEAGYVMTRHLLDLGYERIGFVSNDLELAPTIYARIAGYKKALRERDIKPDNKDIYIIAVTEPDEVSKFIKKSHLEAIFCVNDYTAGFLMQTLASLGIKVPDDIAVIGIDDLEDCKKLHTSPITTIRQPIKQISRLAAQVMVERLEDPSLLPVHIYIKGELIVRESCGALLSGRSAVKGV